MARTISATRPVGPAGYGAEARAIMDEVARRSPGAFMGNQRAQEAMATKALQAIGQQELAKDIAHQGQVAQAILGASRAEGQRALQRERLEDAKAAADDWRPRVARVAGAAAPALAMGAMAYEHYNSPEQKALRAAKAARPDSSMPMPGQMNPEDLATLRAMSDPEAWATPMEFSESQLQSELAGAVPEFERNQQILERGWGQRPSQDLDALYADAARERRRQLLESMAVRQMRRDLANVPVNPYLEGY